jgi:hypothetical protein
MSQPPAPRRPDQPATDATPQPVRPVPSAHEAREAQEAAWLRLRDELALLNAQLEYARLMLRLDSRRGAG